jgi:hypothetical protein
VRINIRKVKPHGRAAQHTNINTMDILYQSIVHRLQSKIASKLWIDLEAGQIDALDDNYPVQFPAIFIDLANCQWHNLGEGHQQGDINIGIRLALDIYADFHADSPTLADAAQQLKLLNQVHAALHTFGGHVLEDGNGGFLDTHFGKLMRTSFNTERRADGLRVFNMTYTTAIYDDYAAKQYLKVQAVPHVVVQ